MPPEVTPIVVNLAVDITQFRALGSVFPIGATYTVSSTSPDVKSVGGNIIIKSRRPTTLIFSFAQPQYVFVGASFNTSESRVDVGRTEFPRLAIDRSEKGNSLTVVDANDPANAGKIFSYILLVQSTTTGEIGLIDPQIINDTGP